MKIRVLHKGIEVKRGEVKKDTILEIREWIDSVSDEYFPNYDLEQVSLKTYRMIDHDDDQEYKIVID